MLHFMFATNDQALIADLEAPFKAGVYRTRTLQAKLALTPLESFNSLGEHEVVEGYQLVSLMFKPLYPSESDLSKNHQDVFQHFRFDEVKLKFDPDAANPYTLKVKGVSYGPLMYHSEFGDWLAFYEEFGELKKLAEIREFLLARATQLVVRELANPSMSTFVELIDLLAPKQARHLELVQKVMNGKLGVLLGQINPELRDVYTRLFGLQAHCQLLDTTSSTNQLVKENVQRLDEFAVLVKMLHRVGTTPSAE